MKILITVKTYPTISEVHQDEFVCTAGFNENGDWIRLYPVPFRNLNYATRYKKYDWIDIKVKKRKSDWRIETYSPVDIEHSPIKIICHLGTENGWAQRKSVVLKKVYTSLAELINDSRQEGEKTSLAVFKPTLVKDFIFVEEENREWDEKKTGWLKQHHLFEDITKKTIIRKLPYKFSYLFEDENKTASTLMVEDWELGQLYWKQYDKTKDERLACMDVKQKFFDNLYKQRDLYFFLGTNYIHHSRNAKNPFIIVGLFYPPKNTLQNTEQLKLDL
jgi:hypothetical protein